MSTDLYRCYKDPDEFKVKHLRRLAAAFGVAVSELVDEP